MLKEFKNKPQTRLACVIDEKGELVEVKKGIWKYTHQARGCTKTLLEFTVGAKQKAPEAGDYIVFLSKDDIYLCGKEEFEKAWNPVGMRIG